MFWISFNDAKRHVYPVSLLLVPNEYYLVTRLLLEKEGWYWLSYIGTKEKSLLSFFSHCNCLSSRYIKGTLFLSLFSWFQSKVLLVSLLFVSKERCSCCSSLGSKENVVLVSLLFVPKEGCSGIFSWYQRTVTPGFLPLLPKKYCFSLSSLAKSEENCSWFLPLVPKEIYPVSLL